jgi:UDP-N-acetylglucosamine 2-epimerase (non-hydrolysing)
MGLKHAIVLGTRPEIIKMSPIIRALKGGDRDYLILHTGQHYDYEMDGAFFEELDLPDPDYNLGVGSGSHAEQTGRIMQGVEEILLKEKPDMTLVQGDTNTVMAAAIVAAKLHMSLGHVEAGLRSWDRRMPEEINRVVADHVSDLLFAPTEVSRMNLLREGIPEEIVHVTGNTVVDAVNQNLALAVERSQALERLGLDEGEYFLVTLHRSETVDDRSRIKGIFSALRKLRREHGVPVVFPMHPRTQKMVGAFGLSSVGVRAMIPVGYLDFLTLLNRCRLVLTDSGGVQEEACVLRVPCVTLRENTERPETVEVGSNIVAGVNPDRVAIAVDQMLARSR